MPPFYKPGVHEFRDEDKNQFNVPSACDLWKAGKNQTIPNIYKMKVFLNELDREYGDEGMHVIQCKGTKYAYVKCIY